MARFKFNVKGLTELEKKLGKQGQEAVKKRVGETIGRTAVAVLSLADQRVKRQSTDMGHLSRSFQVDGKDLVWEVRNKASYASFIEFGTKTRVKIPPEMRDAAYAVTNEKQFDTFKVAITEWVKRKGLPEDAVYPVMAKLMGAGMDPKPFMYPALKEGTKNLQRDIDDEIDTFLNR